MFDDHPMHDQILDALHQGQSPREVAQWCDPPLSHTSIWKIGKEEVEPIRGWILKAIEDFVAEHGHFPVLNRDDDITFEEIEEDEWLGALYHFRETRVVPALALARRNAALELVKTKRSTNAAHWPAV